MDFVILMAAVSALAIGNSIFFGVYLFRSRKEAFPNKLLAFLLFALALRISKSVIVIAFPDSSEVFPAIGLTGMAAIGPLVLLYLQSLFGRKLNRIAWIHFIPSVLIAFSVAFVDEAVIYTYYQVVVLQIFVYILFGIGYLRKNLIELRTNQLKKDWSIRLLLGVAAIWLAFFYQLMADSFISYIIATSVAVVVLYLLSFWAMHRKKVFSFAVKNGNDEQLKEMAEQVKRFFEEQKIYRKENVTLDLIGEQINQQAYLISRSINEVFHMTFPEFLNSFRIEEVKERLLEDKNHVFSIEAIAYDSGFSTLSAFYTSFKKQVKMTPAEFRKKNS